MIDLPGYELMDATCDGAETVVYRGRRNDGTPVAVKITRNEFPTARELGRLRRELAILQDAGDVPGVVRAFALEKCGRGLALVMEDLGPSSLHDVLAARRLDVGESLEIAVALSSTLEAIHKLRIIHKDIKPRNVMIDAATGQPRLVDFGIAARLSQETPRAASPDALEGTLAYIAPEQTGRMNRIVDLRADLYSLGVTLYEMLTGTLPFQGADPTEIIHSHMARTPMPPHERAQGVPRVLSGIVMQLLAKTPEERYQSARGLAADLAECLSQWRGTGMIEAFPLGKRDVSLELRIPQKLYGREQEVEALLSAFERARLGAAALVLVSGYSGVGKSALVNEIHKPIARRGGYFIRGKFDQISCDVPLVPVAHAFRELIRQILTEPAAALAAWKGKLLAAVGANGRLLVELIPELELILGPQPEAAALGPTEAKNRFGLLVQRFVRVFAAPERPLAIFLDDLQWADPASLRLLGLLLRDPESKHVLIIGTYRDNEVDAAHPLTSTLDELRKAGAAMTEVTLRPLDPATVTQIVAGSLHAGAVDVQPLAALLSEKIQGNPFFLGQFLRALHEDDLLRLDPSSGTWTWDLARIREAKVTDNVADLMLGKLHRLPPATQRALKLAACIGYEFDLDTLATLATLDTPDPRSPGRVAADLWAALREGLVLPLDSDYRLLDASAGAAPEVAASGLRVSYRFLHDRVLQAAYALIEPDHRAEVHLGIGRLLRARSGEGTANADPRPTMKTPRDEDLLDVVHHLNLGAGGLTDEAERADLARLNLRAGRMAKARAAYQAAAKTLSAGMDLLGERGWERDGDLCFALHVEGAQCAYLSGDLPRADALFSALLPRSRSSLERAKVHHLRLILCTTRGHFADAVQEGIEGLSVLGVTLPRTEAEQQAAFGEELMAAAKNLGGRRIDALLDSPRLDDPEREALMQLLGDLSMPSYYVSPGLYAPLVFKLVNLSLEHGHSDISAFGYIAYGFMLAAILGRQAEGYAFGKLALVLNEKLQNGPLVAKVNVVFANYLYLCEPLRAAVPYLTSGRQAALEHGDFPYLSSATFSTYPIRLGAGHQLDEVRGALEKDLVLMQRTQDVTALSVLAVVRQSIANLEGRTRSRTSLSDDAFSEDTFLAGLDEKDQGVTFFYFHALRLQLLYLHGDLAGALEAAELAEPRIMSVPGVYYTALVPFYACLALIASGASGPPELATRRQEALERHRARIAGLAASSPQNFQNKLALIEAEQARVSGRHAEAMDLYERAITLAKQSEFPHEEALANERCGELYLAVGRPGAARGYLTDAHLGYLHWGATAKAEDLARRHAALLGSALHRARHSSAQVTSSVTSGTTLLRHTVGNIRDAALVVRAAQDIAGEIELAKIIERLMKLVVENAPSSSEPPTGSSARPTSACRSSSSSARRRSRSGPRCKSR